MRPTFNYNIMVIPCLKRKKTKIGLTSLFELTQFSGDSWRPSTVGSLISGTIVNDAGSMHANLQKKHELEATFHNWFITRVTNWK